MKYRSFYNFRYNFERLCNDLGRVTNFGKFTDAIPEAYFPKLDTQIASRVWPPRQANAVLSVYIFTVYTKIHIKIEIFYTLF